MDHHLQVVIPQVLLVALLCCHVLGNPMIFLSQNDPDCSQQENGYNSYDSNSQGYQAPQAPIYQGTGYQAPSYQAAYQSPSYNAPGYQGGAYNQPPSYQSANYQAANYQGPSYQETLQAMITETLRALCNIVQSTVIASKQEIAALANVFMQKVSGSNCNTGGEDNNASSQSTGSTEAENIKPVDFRGPFNSEPSPQIENKFGDGNSTADSTLATESSMMTNTTEGVVGVKSGKITPLPSSSTAPSNSTDNQPATGQPPE